MRRPAGFLAALFALCLASGPLAHILLAADPAAPSPPADPRALTYPPLSIAFPKPEKLFLPNGLLVYLFEDHELPLVDLAFYMAAGSIYDPPEEVGVAGLTARLMITGGTAEMTPDQVDQAIESMPAQLSIDAGSDSVSGSLSTLKARFPEALAILASMLRSPRFDASRLDLEKAQVVESIRRRWDTPAMTAGLNFRLLVYGPASPWARLETPESIGRIGRNDLLDWTARYVRPNNLIMGVAGDFEPGAMKKLLRDTFGAWKNGKVTPPAVPKVQGALPVGVHLVDRAIGQSSIEIGHLGVNRFDPDKFPLKILSYILGEGGFDSRLVREVRSTRGLAYSVGGGVGLDSDRGLFEISCRTKAESTVETIQVIREILKQIREAGPTEDEVRQAKEASINSFVFSVDGTVPFMHAYLYYDRYRYPPDFLQTYRDNLAKVTRDQVARAARKHLEPDHLVVLVVGNEKKLDHPLASLGLGDPRRIRLDETASDGR
ncbi:MAG TPA: pitrilysin family protein [Candidatus Polarisedimenticolia bacterium]|nr:pitrilysin family protein [Candidatus Polarisedimenticolia bacterium]